MSERQLTIDQIIRQVTGTADLYEISRAQLSLYFFGTVPYKELNTNSKMVIEIIDEGLMRSFLDIKKEE